MQQPESSVVGKFHAAYLSAVLNYEIDDDGHLLNEGFTPQSFSQCTLARTYIECRDFVVAFSDYFDTFEDEVVDMAGSLFWLTRTPGRQPTFMMARSVFGSDLAETLARAARSCGSRTVSVEGGELLIQ